MATWGPFTCCPLQDVSVTCSGGLALLACGAARLLLQRCSLQGRKGGLLLCGRAAAQLQRCSMRQCGEAAVKVSPTQVVHQHQEHLCINLAALICSCL
jgi:hypothetical protein